jgi:hypothetical protein
MTSDACSPCPRPGKVATTASHRVPSSASSEQPISTSEAPRYRRIEPGRLPAHGVGRQRAWAKASQRLRPRRSLLEHSRLGPGRRVLDYVPILVNPAGNHPTDDIRRLNLVRVLPPPPPSRLPVTLPTPRVQPVPQPAIRREFGCLFLLTAFTAGLHLAPKISRVFPHFFFQAPGAVVVGVRSKKEGACAVLVCRLRSCGVLVGPVDRLTLMLLRLVQEVAP